MIYGAGLGDEESWRKGLTYSKAVFVRMYEVRTVSSVRTLGTIIHGMIRPTELLEAYAELGWICHPDVTSAL